MPKGRPSCTCTGNCGSHDFCSNVSKKTPPPVHHSGDKRRSAYAPCDPCYWGPRFAAMNRGKRLPVLNIK